MTKKWVTPKEIADELNLHISIVYRLCQSGAIEAHRFGDPKKKDGPYRVRRAVLDAYIEKTQIKRVGRPLKDYSGLQESTVLH